MYLANKVQNIQGSADTLLDLAGLEQDEIRPVAEAMEQGGRLAAKAKVTDAILDKCKPIAGTPADCIEAIEEYRDAGCTHVMLELWGERAARPDPPLRGEGSPALPLVIDRERAGRGRARGCLDPELHRLGGGDGARWYAAQCEELGLAVQWQQVEDGRANVLATRAGTGGGPTLMFNGHLDTSYSGREPWLAGIPGFQPEGFVRDGRIYGLGISNMKGALVAYLAAVRALGDAALKGDVMLAAVAGEIEKTQQGDAQGAEFRGYAAGSRHLVGHGGAADMCILGEPTEQKLVLAHFGTLWLRLSTSGPFIHTAFSSGRLEENSIVRMRDVLDRVLAWLPEWEEEMSATATCAGSRTSARSRAASAGASRGRRTGPTSSSTCACRRTSRWRRRGGRRSSSRAGWRASRPRST